MTRTAYLLLAACLPLFSGCGTFFDALAGPVDDHYYYRGVRLDVAGINNGVPIMALDVPFSALADTLMVPCMAYHQLTDPPGTQQKSALNVAAEEMGKSVATEFIKPIMGEMINANAELQKQQPSPPLTPAGYSQD